MPFPIPWASWFISTSAFSMIAPRAISTMYHRFVAGVVFVDPERHQPLHFAKSRDTRAMPTPTPMPTTTASTISNAELVPLALQEPLGWDLAAESFGSRGLVDSASD